MLRHVESRGAIQGLRICRGAPSISHLLFADDTLVFCKAKEGSCKLLETFWIIIGSKNTGADLKRALSSNLAIPVRADLGKYLGLLAEVDKSKTEIQLYKAKSAAEVGGLEGENSYSCQEGSLAQIGGIGAFYLCYDVF
ncbi:uncharacterized protein LOC131298506 [Rhododendron vialii]|uniref:uncharacterized protein LOC131298506 n=1 Tax=Rhododendron vialii TaxID=182163 RepID=UPI00265E3E95|nr:uncharacterized protein LOC131298506 [Rhododendron vialii]